MSSTGGDLAREEMAREDMALADLDAAVCSDGAPSARNLLVTLFGDVVLLAGADAEVSVQSLATLLDEFGVNERLVRTSLTRLVNDGLLATRASGRRSFYRVAPEAVELFRTADERIYRGASPTWDGAWTIVVVDPADGTSKQRSRLRQELGWAGLGVVAPNVMASPVVGVETVAEVIARVDGIEHALVSRSSVVGGRGLLGADELARRCAPLDEIGARYEAFATRFGLFDESTLTGLSPERASKLRILLVATFRRIVLADPLVPSPLLPDAWIGDRARAEARRVYAAIAPASDAHVAASTGLAFRTDRNRFS